jgi:tripartite ATP-independent transporter DctP family solute receptor
MKGVKNFLKSFLSVILVMVIAACARKDPAGVLHPKISLVNSPTDILTLGAGYLSREINSVSGGTIQPKVYHSGVLSGGKGSAEIEMCQQGSIEIHITTTAYLANLVPKASIVSLPFLFRDIDQVIGLTGSHSPVLETINRELNDKNLNIIAWWPRGFRQLTNNKRPVRDLDDLKGLKFRVMNNRLFVDNMNIMGANPVPMDWGEVYNSLQLNTIDGQENAEDVIFSSRLYEVQKYMTIWDYSTDVEIVLVNFEWWNNLSHERRKIIQQVADSSIAFEVDLLKKNTTELRQKIDEKGVEIHYLSPEEKGKFRNAVRPVWEKYEKIFTKEYLDSFLKEVGRF